MEEVEHDTNPNQETDMSCFRPSCNDSNPCQNCRDFPAPAPVRDVEAERAQRVAECEARGNSWSVRFVAGFACVVENVEVSS